MLDASSTTKAALPATTASKAAALKEEKRRKLFHHDMMPLCEKFYRFWALVAHQFSTTSCDAAVILLHSLQFHSLLHELFFAKLETAFGNLLPTSWILMKNKGCESNGFFQCHVEEISISKLLLMEFFKQKPIKETALRT